MVNTTNKQNIKIPGRNRDLPTSKGRWISIDCVCAAASVLHYGNSHKSKKAVKKHLFCRRENGHSTSEGKSCSRVDDDKFSTAHVWRPHWSMQRPCHNNVQGIKWPIQLGRVLFFFCSLPGELNENWRWRSFRSRCEWDVDYDCNGKWAIRCW